MCETYPGGVFAYPVALVAAAALPRVSSAVHFQQLIKKRLNKKTFPRVFYRYGTYTYRKIATLISKTPYRETFLN